MAAASATTPSCPTDFSRFELYAPRASLGPFGQVCRAVGLVESNVLRNDDALDRLGPEKVFGRYYHLYQKWVDHADKHSTSRKLLNVFHEIDNTRRLVFANYKAKRDNPRDTPSKIDFAGAFRAAASVRDENASLSSELTRFVTFLEIMYRREMRELEKRVAGIARSIGPAAPVGAISMGPTLEERFKALKNTRKRARKQRRTRRHARKN